MVILNVWMTGMDEDAVSPARPAVVTMPERTAKEKYGCRSCICPSKTEYQTPLVFDALGEFRMPLEATVFWLGALTHPWPHADADNRKVILLIPGFMAGDVTLAPMEIFSAGWVTA